jgi:hypothetical protein
MDTKADGILQRQHEHQMHMTEIRRMQEAQQRQAEEQQRWIEHWKNLPQLPKPPAKR